MKNFTCIFFLLSTIFSFGQERNSRLEAVEKEIHLYSLEHKSNFTLPKPVVNSIIEGITKEHLEHGLTDTELAIKKALDSYKEYEIRKLFFELHPDKRRLYFENVNQSLGICDDGGFEGTSPLDGYTFRHAILTNAHESINTVTTGADFIPFLPATSPNTFSSFATLVTSGFDVSISSLNRINTSVSGNTMAVKINKSGNNPTQSDVTTMSKSFKVSGDFIDFDYSAVFQPDHEADERPFFSVRLYRLSNPTEIIRSVNIIALDNDCLLTPEGNFLYTGWQCGRINTGDLIGEEVTLEFVVGDCSPGGHYGTVYIDNICSSSCSNPAFGSVQLNTLPVISCPTSTQSICGTYIAPPNTENISGANFSLEIIQDGVIINTIASASSITATTFCFNVPISLFGLTPFGDFEFRVLAHFVRDCDLGTINLDPVVDNSTNDFGADVRFEGCVNAADDTASFTTCILGSVSVLSNDSVFGVPATTGTTTRSLISSSPQLVFNSSTGLVSVVSGTGVGIYTLVYSICSTSNSLQCDTATVTVTVSSSPIDAVNNNFSSISINGCTGGTTSNVIANDLNCTAPIVNSQVSKMIIDNGGLTGATINSNGTISVPPYSSPGIYTLTYKICQLSVPTNCDTATVIIKVVAGATPVFSFLTSFCEGTDVPSLPTTSNNGIPGTWNPAVISNLGSGSYVFTPNGNCSASITKHVTIIPYNLPIFTFGTSYCVGSPTVTLPTVSSNGIAGTWSPAVITTSTTGTFNYVFTANGGVCSNLTVSVTIQPKSIVPAFSFATTICKGTVAPLLPLVSSNGISGTWSPSNIDNTTTANYIFTPAPNQCAVPKTLSVTVLPTCNFSLEWNSDVGCELMNEEDSVKYLGDINDGPCIRVCENSVIEYHLTGSTAVIATTTWNITGGIIQLQSATSVKIKWGSDAFCSIQGVITLNDGSQLQINRCIEKVVAPVALFGVAPLLSTTTYTGCVNTPILFKNLTTNNNGNETLYYNWDFGDGSMSTEFEPAHIYSETGIYKVVLKAFNGCSCVGEHLMHITIDKSDLAIECPSVACEGERTSYTVTGLESGCDPVEWEIEGGSIVWMSIDHKQIEVVWDHVDEFGYGYLSVSSRNCSTCVTSVKVPVVLQRGTIFGSDTICYEGQGLYSMPEWPTTDFKWTLDASNTGAVLLQGNQRNEIVIQAAISGYIDLYCNYTNTLLGCGGTAQKRIFVKQAAFFEGTQFICSGVLTSYSVVNANGNSLGNVNWKVTGPNNFSQTGNGSTIPFTFPSGGVYNLDITSPNYCLIDPFNVTVSAVPEQPLSISGAFIVCPGAPYNYSCPAPSGSVTRWEVENGSIIGSSLGNEVLVNFDPLATTPFLIKTWFEKEGCSSAVLVTPIEKETPNLTIEGETIVCGSTFNSYSVDYDTGESYTWSIVPESAGNVQSGQNTNNITVLWNQPTANTSVKLTVRKCGTDFEELYPVSMITTPAVTIHANDTNCAGDPIYFSFSFTPAVLFESATWDFGDGSLEETYTNNNLVSHTYIAPITGSTSYTVRVTVAGPNGCTVPGTTTHVVTVYPMPELTITPMTDLDLCNPTNTPASYTYTVNKQGGFASTDIIKWYKNGILIGGIGNTPTLNVSNLGTGNFHAEVTSSNDCTANTATINVYDNCDTEGGGCVASEFSSLDINITSSNNTCQGISATVTYPGTPIDVGWDDSDFEGAIVTLENNQQFKANNLEPGEYNLGFTCVYAPGGCPVRASKTFIIPYKAGLKHTVSCGANNTYNVTLQDHSVYFPNTPIQQFRFTKDNGASWQTGTTVNGIAQITYTGLVPGVYQIGIRISRTGYATCTKKLYLNLPNFPSAAFTFDNNACANSAMPFFATDSSPDLKYEWSFGDGTENLQKNPVKTFATDGTKFVTLTVTNKYGCSASVTQGVNVIAFDLRGTVTTNPTNVCLGGTMTLTYNPEEDSNIPVLYHWYKTTINSAPVAITTIPTTTVNENGRYFVNVTNADGCENFNIDPVGVGFIPLPEAPSITGKNTVCEGEIIVLKVPENDAVTYRWSVNGVAQPQWNGIEVIEDPQSMLGIRVYEAKALVPTGIGSFCSSAAGSFTVEVFEPPMVPELAIASVVCEPYTATVIVTNPQNGMRYYWSNGGTGTSTEVTHDGPLQVRAQLNDCVATAQLDLPTDLATLAWIFPKGCFESCESKHPGHIIGPLGDYSSWKWKEDGNATAWGTGEVDAFHGVHAGHDHELELSTPYCTSVIGTAHIVPINCEKCELEYEVKRIEAVAGSLNSQCSYLVELFIDNPFGTPIWITISSPDGEGYFIANNLNVPAGGATFYVQFYPLNGFAGGNMNFLMEGDYVGLDKNCMQEGSMAFPVLCNVSERESDTKEDEAEKGSTYSLSVAPNPVAPNSITTVYYKYASGNGSKTLWLTDSLGRVLQREELKTANGAVVFDFSGYASGYYMIVMKENEQVVGQQKVMVR